MRGRASSRMWKRALEIGPAARHFGRRVVQTCSLIAACVAPSGAQERADARGPQPEYGTLRVLVYDGTPCLPMVGLPIVMAESGATAATNSWGIAVFYRLPAGVHTLEIMAAGREVSSTRIVIDPGETLQIVVDVAHADRREQAGGESSGADRPR